jgi:hypothetical protein
MKTAILISGGQRYLRRGIFETIKIFSNWGEVDFFIRLWKSPGQPETPEQLIKFWHDNGIPKHWNFRTVQILEDNPPHHPPYLPLNLAEWAPNHLTMFWGVVKANDLRVKYQEATGTEYNLVFRLRTDVWPSIHSRTSDIYNDIIDLAEYVEPAKTSLFTGTNFSDTLQFGSPQMFDKYVNYWDHLKKMSVNWDFVHPEESLENYFKVSDIPYGYIPAHVSAWRSGQEYKVRPGNW